MLHKDLLCLHEGCPDMGGDKILFCHHILNSNVKVRHKPQVAVRQDTDQLTLPADRHA